MKRNETGLIYHSLHGRRYRGCLPVTFVLSALFVAGLLWVLPVRMPERVPSEGKGQLFYRNDSLIHFQMRQRSPLPMNLPAYVDPARQEAAAAVESDGRVDAKLMPAPPFNFLSTPPDSAVLDADDLLALPPEESPADVSPSPTSGEEVQP